MSNYGGVHTFDSCDCDCFIVHLKVSLNRESNQLCLIIKKAMFAGLDFWNRAQALGANIQRQTEERQQPDTEPIITPPKIPDLSRAQKQTILCSP